MTPSHSLTSPLAWLAYGNAGEAGMESHGGRVLGKRVPLIESVRDDD